MEYFELNSDKLIVTDPCYNRGTWCQGIVENCLPGKWFCYIVNDGGDVAELHAVHEKYRKRHLYTETKAPFEIGVDSGQAGVFDESLYPVGECGDYGDLNTFYGRACDATEKSHNVGLITEGAVSRSGYGDGGYDAYIGTAYATDDHGGKCVSIRIVFIEEDDDE